MVAKSSPKILLLDSLASGIPAITYKKAGVHFEACAWCLLECGHQKGVLLKVIGDKHNDVYSLSWNTNLDIDALNRAYNKDDGPEQGAEAIAFLLILDRTNYTAIRRSVTSTGIDYWLGKKDVLNNQIFDMTSARLEVSGILRENKTNRINYRTKKKIAQTKQSDSSCFPVYVVIVEFGQPIAEVSFRNV